MARQGPIKQEQTVMVQGVAANQPGWREVQWTLNRGAAESQAQHWTDTQSVVVERGKVFGADTTPVRSADERFRGLP
jgi:hypothetical protein